MTVSAATVTLDKTEYCRYAIGMNVITVTMKPTSGTLTAGDSFTFSVLRLPAPNWPEQHRTIMTRAVVATTADVAKNSVSCSFQLGIDDLDADGIARAISGQYNAVVGPTASPLVKWVATSNIVITLVPIAEIRHDWCYGAPLRASEVLMPRFQPRLITGVTVDEVSAETMPSPKSLVLTYTSGTWTLRWDGGAINTILPIKTQYILMDEIDTNYIMVTVDPTLLPTSNITEKLLISPQEMSDEMLTRRINNATNSVESMLGFALEPHLYTTMPLFPGQVSEHNRLYDHWDRVGRPVDYIVPTDGYAWPSFRLPYQWCIKMHNLYGFHSVDKIIEIEGDWWNSTIDRMNGYVTLIPALASFARWTVYTHPMLAPFFMHRNIASFWQYNATFGLPDLQEEGRSVVREAIARMGAASILVEASRAYQGGLGSESTSRDGVSNSRSFNPGGPYASTIQQHQQWLQVEIPRIKFKIGGVFMGMIGAS